jgi:hypothetical protein
MSRACVCTLFALLALGLLGATAASGASRAPQLTLAWLAPTPADGKSFVVKVGERLSIPLNVSAGARIEARGLPQGASVSTGPSGSMLTWAPSSAGIGPHAVVLRAQRGVNAFTPPRTLFLYGAAASQPLGARPTVTALASPGLSRWAYIFRPAVVRAAPALGSRVVTRLSPDTLDGTPNLVLVLASTRDRGGRVWYRVRLPIRPNNSTGWILWGAVSDLHAVRTYLVIDRKLFVATLYRGGVPIFRTRVGVGRPYWPTPAGDFYIREILTGFHDPTYGPVAFGTSARSGVLTDWHGGGGVIGIHGTNQPEILPGRVSHGCVRMPNAAASRLYRLMPLGTPVAIR